MKAFEKFVYWLIPPEFDRLKGPLAEKGIDPVRIKKAVCLPLSRDVSMAFVEPQVWEEYELCRRQLSWYGESPFNGKILLVSSSALNDYGLHPETIIRDATFRTRTFPDRTGRLQLIARESYLKSRPEAWEQIAREDPEQQKRWLKVMGLGHLSYEELFVGHCANHANFIEPEYFMLDGEEKVPYSIGRTPFVCSACLEFYNIIGTGQRRKYVVPCPGAVLFAGMAASRYYEVSHP
jgi:hypothetical protein